MRNRKFQKNNKKIKKIKKYRCGFISNQNTLQQGCEREKIKMILPFHSNPTRDRKFQKLKDTIMASFQEVGKV